MTTSKLKSDFGKWFSRTYWTDKMEDDQALKDARDSAKAELRRLREARS